MSGSLSYFYFVMIILRDKQFAFANLAAAVKGVSKTGEALTKGQRAMAGLKSASTIGAYGTLAGGAALGLKAAGTTKDALTGEMGQENGAGY